jgi:hypothetical protein
VVTSDLGQKFFKSNIPNMVAKSVTRDDNPLTYLNCTTKYYMDHDDLIAYPGEQGGPSCGCNSIYFESEENLDLLIDGFYIDSKSSTKQTREFIQGFDFDDRLAVSTRERACTLNANDIVTNIDNEINMWKISI